MERLVHLLTLAGTMCLALLMAAPTAHGCTCPAWTDSDCYGIAVSGIGSPYKWGGACWKTTDRSWGGADCSGYLVKAWQVPRRSAITEQYHPYGTWHLFNETTHWYAISRSYVWIGDALGYPDPDGGGPATGHVVMYVWGDPYGLAYVMEAPGSGLKIREVWKDVSSSKWRARRRHNMSRVIYLV